jgi:hypothetical protein
MTDLTKEGMVEETLSLDVELKLRFLSNPEQRSREAELFDKKWWDYRLMGPGAATVEFVKHYKFAYRESFARYRDIQMASDANPLRLFEDIWDDTNNRSAVISARQAADSIGVPYGAYCLRVIEVAAHRGRRYLPRPNQLYGEFVVEDVATWWAERLSAYIELPKHPIFTAKNYAGAPVQDQFYEWLCGLIKRRESAPAALANLIYRKEIIPASVAAKLCGSVLADSARLWFEQFK